MRILEDKFITYDEQFKQCKTNYTDSVDAILRAKFDLLFEYSKKEPVELLRADYVETKSGYDQLYLQWKQTDPNHPKLKKDCAELIKKIKERYDPAVRDQLNDALNQIHLIEYKRIYNDVVPRPTYDLEIRVL
jgi:hypothetical protein